MRRASIAALLALALLAGGCGAAAPDLFEVARSGADKNANVRLVVSDGGLVRCNDAKPVPLDGERLLTARQLARDLGEQAILGIELPTGRGSILSYRARLEAGTIAFSDTSRDRPQSFDRLAAFTADVAEHVCGIERR
jgi:hypothetical protein